MSHCNRKFAKSESVAISTYGTTLDTHCCRHPHHHHRHRHQGLLRETWTPRSSIRRGLEMSSFSVSFVLACSVVVCARSFCTRTGLARDRQPYYLNDCVVLWLIKWLVSWWKVTMLSTTSCQNGWTSEIIFRYNTFSNIQIFGRTKSVLNPFHMSKMVFCVFVLWRKEGMAGQRVKFRLWSKLHFTPPKC